MRNMFIVFNLCLNTIGVKLLGSFGQTLQRSKLTVADTSFPRDV